VNRPRLLDLFCCQGGASRGYVDAGFDVVGIDIYPQPRYPYEFIQADAIALDAAWIAANFEAAHASPPCQAHTLAWKINKREHPRLIPPTRALLQATGLPYVIENVEEARDELRDPVRLCGTMFGLHTYRHRLFEVGGFEVIARPHGDHLARNAKMGRPAEPDEYMHIVGNFSGVERARGIMRMPWANRDGLREAIPPAYTELIGIQLLAHLRAVAA
jgi:DNA (cytosine-5)-methyltransferase 1